MTLDELVRLLRPFAPVMIELVVVLFLLLYAISKGVIITRARADRYIPTDIPTRVAGMGIDGPKRVSGDIKLWQITYTDPPHEYAAALQLCKDEGAPCSFLVVSANAIPIPSSVSYRILEIQRFPLGGDDMLRVFFAEDVRDAS